MIDKNTFNSLTPGTKVETNKGFKGVVASVTNNPFFVVEIDFETTNGKVNKYYYDLHTQGNKWEIAKILLKIFGKLDIIYNKRRVIDYRSLSSI